MAAAPAPMMLTKPNAPNAPPPYIARVPQPGGAQTEPVVYGRDLTVRPLAHIATGGIVSR